MPTSLIEGAHALALAPRTIFADISPLRLRIGPPAVLGLVVPVRINAVDSMAQRSLAHVGSEMEEVVAPTVTNPYPALAIQSVVLRSRVMASLDHIGLGAV